MKTYRNTEHYSNPTAGQAVFNVMRETRIKSSRNAIRYFAIPVWVCPVRTLPLHPAKGGLHAAKQKIDCPA